MTSWVGPGVPLPGWSANPQSRSMSNRLDHQTVQDEFKWAKHHNEKADCYGLDVRRSAPSITLQNLPIRETEEEGVESRVTSTQFISFLFDK